MKVERSTQPFCYEKVNLMYNQLQSMQKATILLGRDYSQIENKSQTQLDFLNRKKNRQEKMQNFPDKISKSNKKYIYSIEHMSSKEKESLYNKERSKSISLVKLKNPIFKKNTFIPHLTGEFFNFAS